MPEVSRTKNTASPYDSIAMFPSRGLPWTLLVLSHAAVQGTGTCSLCAFMPLEAIPLRSIEAKQIAEELIIVFARVRLPKEILTN